MFLFEWFWQVLRELYQLYEDNLSSGGPARRMGNKLRILYGRGEIDKATFLKLRNNLEKGYSIDGELQMYHRQAGIRFEIEGKYLDHHYDQGISRSLENLYLNRAVLEEVRHEMKLAYQSLETSREWIQKQAADIEQSALGALPNEEAARAFLEIRQDLLERIQYLESRASMMQQNLRQIDMLKAELGLYEAELMVLESQEHYAALKLSLHR